MKKTTKKRLIVAAVGLCVAATVAALAWAFSGKKDSYCSVIPDDAVALARLDFNQFVNEHDIEIKEQKYLPLALVAQMIKTSGVDFSKPIYAFACSERKSGAVIPIKDIELFRDFLKNNGYISFTLSQAKGYDWAMSGQYAAIFDNEKCLLMTGVGMNVRNELVELMEQDEDDSVLDESLYENISGCKKPFAAIISMQEVLESVDASVLKEADIDEDELDMDVLISFDAKKEKATLAIDLFGNSRAARKAIDSKTALMENLKGTYINAIDSDPLLWLSFGGLKNLSDQVKNVPQLQEFKQMGIDVEHLLSSFSGEAAVIVPNNNPNQAILLAEVENNNVLDIIKQAETLSMGQVKFVKISDEDYVCSMGGMAIFAGIKNGTFYLTNAQQLVSKVGENINSNMSMYEDEVKSVSAYMSINAAQAFSASTKLIPGSRSMMLLLGGKLSKIDRFYMNSNGTHTEFVVCAKEGEDIIKGLLK